MESPDPVSMLSTDPLLREKLSREMTHQNFEPPEQIGTAKMLIDMAAQEAIPAYGFARSGEDMINSLKEGDLGWAALAGAGMLPGIPGMTVFHGTPHRFAPTEKNPLGEFDASKIGAGEGAQAYGHGLYFAENPGVAQEYARRVTGGFRYSDDELKHMEWRLANAKENAAKGDIYAGSEIRDITERLAARDQPGVYKVDIPDEHIAKMLEWDKKLGEQPEAVRNALSQLPAHESLTGSDFYDSLVKDESGRVGAVSRHFDEDKGYGVAFGNDPITWNSYGGYTKELANDLLSNRIPREQASAMLRQAGIPGIRYLDQGSRDAGQGTSNFVLFDPTIANILERME